MNPVWHANKLSSLTACHANVCFNILRPQKTHERKLGLDLDPPSLFARFMWPCLRTLGPLHSLAPCQAELSNELYSRLACCRHVELAVD